MVQMSEDGIIREFQEKPQNPAELDGKPGISLASMGIYIFDVEFLVRELIEAVSYTHLTLPTICSV